MKPSDTPNPAETQGPDISQGKEAKNVSLSLVNPFTTEDKYKDTVLVGNNAEVRVRVTDEDGKPVANREVVLTSKAIHVPNNNYRPGNLSLTEKTTDAQGYVTFVYGFGSSTYDGKAVDSTRTDCVGSYKLTASVRGTVGVDDTADVKGSIDVKFAAITVGNGTGVTDMNKWVTPGVNTFATSINGNINGGNLSSVVGTKDRNSNDVDYVTSQQVSSKDKEDHAVTFKSGANGLALVMPNSEGVDYDPQDINVPVDYDTGRYSTYANKTSWGRVIDEVNAADLQYATVNFGKLSLSKYSRFVVQAYIVSDKNKPTTTATRIDLKDPGAYVNASDGDVVSGNFSVQIPVSVNSGYLYVTAIIQSKGQVNTDVNEGFIVKNVVGVKKKGHGAGENLSKALEGITVEWNIDNEATYTLESTLPASAGSIKNALDSVMTTDAEGKPVRKYAGCTYKYKVPAFPRTGNGIIIVYDSSNKPVAYYAIPTDNTEIQKNADGSNRYENGHLVYKNVNALRNDVSQLYLISEKEANTNGSVGKVTNVGNDVKVNSYETGITHVIGEIKSSNPAIKIDATNRLIYTSVNWNPIPNSSGGPAAGEIGAALVGQQITLKAQLLDQNENPATTSNVPVEFYVGNQKIDKTSLVIGGTNTLDGASVVSVDTVTNSLGVAELKLVSNKPTQALNISAKAGSNSYDLAYTLGGNTVKAPYVDLYWVDANLYFEPNANTQQLSQTKYNTPTKHTSADGVNIMPTAGSHWAYEVRTNGDITAEAVGAALGGALAGCTSVEITGLTIHTAGTTDSVGTITDNANGKANITSTKAGKTYLVNTLNSDSVGDNVTFTFKKGAAVIRTLSNIGTGTTTLDKKLTLDIVWEASAPSAEFIIPTGKKADIVNGGLNGVPVYVKVQDMHGNPLENKKVTLKVTGKGGVLDTDGTTIKVTQDVETNKEGIATFIVKPNGTDAASTASAGESSVLTATVAGITGSTPDAIKWVDVAPATSGLKTLGIELDENNNKKIVYDYTNKTIKLTFNNDIYAKSVVKEQFKVTYGTDEQIVTDVAVDGKTVTLSIPALTNVNKTTAFTVEITPQHEKDKPTIQYSFASVDGQLLANPFSETFHAQ